ncbi:plasmid maintenance protein [Borreliella garinii]|uniref:plasmid maintenance protein n=1 Tax=Borreliella garinii TaxID=29519 RepID=UPI0029310E8F|nr:plasmid maintenance protein [Borreliella garinii]WNZ73101.1 plasmid maintenance protein [Borreliella garinii]
MEKVRKFKNNKCQHKLIVLVSTLSYINNKHKKYSQSNILYYFNENLKRNGQSPIKIKTLQNYLYKLEKEFEVTNNYYKHLGINCGTEIYYKLKYQKEKCYHKINQYFKEKKEIRFKLRVNNFFKKRYLKKGSVELQECNNNNNNNKEKEKTNNIENFQIKNYANKCKFVTNSFLKVLNLNIKKNIKIEMLKEIKKIEDFFKRRFYKSHKKSKNIIVKRKELALLLENTKKTLEKEGLNKKQLDIDFKNLYLKYKNKPHFILDYNKYDDLKQIINKIKKKTNKPNIKAEQENVKNNILNILFEQLKSKFEIDNKVLLEMLKDYINQTEKPKYCDLFNNKYYYDLTKLIKNKDKFLIKEKVIS